MFWHLHIHHYRRGGLRPRPLAGRRRSSSLATADPFAVPIVPTIAAVAATFARAATRDGSCKDGFASAICAEFPAEESARTDKTSSTYSNLIFLKRLTLQKKRMELEGKHAVVCGSTQGIGLATAQLLANRGARITLIARNEEKLKKALDSLISSRHQEHDYLIADFSEPTNLKSVIEDFVSKGNNPHILVNNT